MVISGFREDEIRRLFGHGNGSRLRMTALRLRKNSRKLQKTGKSDLIVASTQPGLPVLRAAGVRSSEMSRTVRALALQKLHGERFPAGRSADLKAYLRGILRRLGQHVVFRVCRSWGEAIGAGGPCRPGPKKGASFLRHRPQLNVRNAVTMPEGRCPAARARCRATVVSLETSVLRASTSPVTR